MRTTIGRKIALAFIFIMLVVAVMIGMMVRGYNKVIESLTVIELESAKRGAAGNLRFAIAQMHMASDDYIITEDKTYKLLFRTHEKNAEEYKQQLLKLPLSSEQKEMLQKIDKGLDSIITITNKIFKIRNPGSSKLAVALMVKIDNKFASTINVQTTRIFNSIGERIEKERVLIEENKTAAMQLIYGISLCGFLLSFMVVFYVVKRISKSVEKLTHASQRIASGDYAHRPESVTHDEVAILTQTFSEMADAIESSHRELEKEKQFNENIVATVPLGLLVLDGEYRVVSANHRFAELFSTSEEEVRGKVISDVLRLCGFYEQCITRISAATDEQYFECDCHCGKALHIKIHTLQFAKEYADSNEKFLFVIDDITERKHVDDELKSSREMLNTTFNSIPDAIVVADAKYTIISCNNASEKILGFTREELLGKPYTIFIAPEMFTDVRQEEHQKTLYERGYLEQEEFLFKRKNGEVFHASYSVALVKDKNGTVNFLVGSIRDMTERKRIELALQESKERLKDIIEYSTNLFYSHTPEHVLTYVSPQSQHFFDCEPEEALVRWTEFATDNPINEEGFLSTVRAIKTGERQHPYQLEIVGKKGRVLWVEVNEAPVVREGKTVAIVGSLTDITEQKAAEGSVKKLFAAIEETTDTVIITDRNGTIEYINPAFIKCTGYAKEEIIGQNPRMFKSGEQDVKFYQHCWETITSGKVFHSVFLNKRKNGEKFYIEQSIIPVTNAVGSVTHFVSTGRDITERLKLEEQVRQTQKMESIGTLAGGIAHDFNNILGIILGHATILEKNRDNEQKYTASTEAIHNAVKRGAGVVKQLLTFARKTDILFEDVNVNDTVREFIAMMKETFPKTINLVLELDPTLAQITADRNQLYQALLNLSVNSLDAMTSKHGTLTISTKTVAGAYLHNRYHGASNENYICISVCDTGIGMDAHTKSRLFEPFFTTKELGKGTGLGLAVVYGVVKSHHGYIDVESETGKGTTFSIYLPIPAQKFAVELISTEEEIKETTGGNETVLIVEDEEDLLEMLQALLEECGYKVLIASDGEEAIEMFQMHNSAIDVVVSDVGLPQMSGWEAFQKMQSINPSLRVVFASGFFDPKLKSAMIKAGAQKFIQKPYIPSEIFTAIRETLDETSV